MLNLSAKRGFDELTAQFPKTRTLQEQEPESIQVHLANPVFGRVEGTTLETGWG